MKDRIKNDRKVWTILEIINWTTLYFKSAKIETPRMDAEILLAYVLNIKRIDLYLNYNKPLSQKELNLFKELIIRRKNREPVAYITQTKEFWSMELKVTRDVLIPRPDTEILVEAAISAIKKIKKCNPKLKLKILEIGVGTGAIISAIAFSAQDNIFFGTDICPKALDVAKENTKKYNLKIDFFLSDCFSIFKNEKIKFDIIISNPPYIPTRDIEELTPDIKLYEPLLALDGGKNGLDCINKIVSGAHLYLNENGLLAIEIGFDQKKRTFDIINSKKKYKNTVCLKDYGGNDRAIISNRATKSMPVF